MKTKLFALLFLSYFSIAGASAQNYKTALGLKFYPGGVSFKQFTTDKVSLEAIGYFYNYGTRITGLYEFNYSIPGVNGLGWYVGPGAHVNFYKGNYGGATSFGIDGVLGLDFKVPNAPLNISLDWQPSIEFGDNFNNGFTSGWGGIGFRYVLR